MFVASQPVPGAVTGADLEISAGIHEIAVRGRCGVPALRFYCDDTAMESRY